MYIVLMAGGVGSRFWPRSRQLKPKQLLNLLGETSMLQMTYKRIRPLADPDHILVVTSEELRKEVAAQLSELPAHNIIAEPVGRNTAPCIGLAASIIARRSGNQEVMITLPADHLIKNGSRFRKMIEKAADYAKEKDCLVTIGIKPTYPETGYGYIQRGEVIGGETDTSLYKVKTFAEKPNIDTAKRFLKSGDFLWNSGMFIWTVSAIRKEFELYEPEMAEGFKALEEAVDTPGFETVLSDVYAKIKSVSIDYAIMEKADRVCILEASFEWNDLGSWEAAYTISEKDENGNAVQAKAFQGVDARNNFIYSTKKLVAAVDVENLVVVETDDALLICKKDQSQKVKDVVDALRRKKQTEYL